MIYHLLGMKQSGWLTKTGQYSSDVTAAASYTREAALTLARRHKSAANILIPVRQEDIV